MFSNHIMYVLVVAIVMIGLVLRARYKEIAREKPEIEAAAIEDELEKVKGRLAVLERIAIEKDDSLSAEIERLRDR